MITIWEKWWSIVNIVLFKKRMLWRKESCLKIIPAEWMPNTIRCALTFQLNQPSWPVIPTDIVGAQIQVIISLFVTVLFTCWRLRVGFCCWEHEDMEGTLGPPVVQSPGASVSDGAWSAEWKSSRNQSRADIHVSTITQIFRVSEWVSEWVVS